MVNHPALEMLAIALTAVIGSLQSKLVVRHDKRRERQQYGSDEIGLFDTMEK